MTPTDMDREALGEVGLLDLATYLKAKGWERSEGHTEFAESWRHGDDVGTDIVVPRVRNVRDYLTRMREILDALEDLESRSWRAILADIQLVGTDVVRLKHPSDTPEGSILLLDGVHLFEKALDMVAAAAGAAVAPRASLPPRRPPQAIDYLNRVRLGQTERSSYVVKILSRIDSQSAPAQPSLWDLWEDPFPRQVTMTLAKSLTAMDEAVRSARASGSYDSFVAAVPKGLSANLCDSVLGIVKHEARGVNVTIDLAWAIGRPVPPDVRSTFEFRFEDADILNEGARVLRAVEPISGTTLAGVVVNLHRDEGESDGLATVSAVVNGSIRKLRVPLEEVDYIKAVEAHRESRGVMFLADLAAHGRSYVATSVRDFRII